MDCIVYKISSDLTSHTYYGYARARDEIHAKQLFLKGASRAFDPNIRRGDVEWLQKHNHNKTDNIVLEVHDVCIDEQEAWMARNDLRSSDVCSVTGPSQWPIINYDHAKEYQPERVEAWKHNKQINESATARQAYQLQAWMFDQIKKLCLSFDKQMVIYDLDTLTPMQFSIKYDLPITYKQ